MARPQYPAVYSAFPSTLLHQPCPESASSENHCALRVSIALEGAGFTIGNDFTANKCRHNYARGASDLAAYLRTKWGNRDQGYEAPNSMPAAMSGKKGIVLFERIPGFSGQGHIDVFDGTEGLTHSKAGGETGVYWNAETIWFWELEDGSDKTDKPG